LDDEQKELKWSLLNDAQTDRFVLEMYNAGNYSPVYVSESQAMPGIDLLDEEEDAKKLLSLRIKDEPSLSVSSKVYKI
jgi:hypothetical protein